jgi:hypothetical protein
MSWEITLTSATNNKENTPLVKGFQLKHDTIGYNSHAIIQPSECYLVIHNKQGFEKTSPLHSMQSYILELQQEDNSNQLYLQNNKLKLIVTHKNIFEKIWRVIENSLYNIKHYPPSKEALLKIRAHLGLPPREYCYSKWDSSLFAQPKREVAEHSIRTLSKLRF